MQQTSFEHALNESHASVYFFCLFNIHFSRLTNINVHFITTMQDKSTIYWLLINPLKMWQSSSTWKQ